MRTIYLYIVAVALAISGLNSCNNEDDAIHSVQDQTADLYIETEIAVAETGLRSTKALLSNFQEGSALSLFVTNGTMGTNYPQGPYNNVKAQYNAAKWILEPKVKLSDTPATIFAFYPYTEAIGNGVGSIYVQHTDQIDYMYGTHAEGQGEINKHNTGVRLSMKHALSLLEFKMHKDYYKGEGKLTKIEVRNAQYTDMYSRGTINLETGLITGYYGRHEPAIIENNEGLLEIPDVLSPDTDNYQRIMVLPSTNRSMGNIVVDFHIDGDIYTWKVPQGNTWKPGSKYSYDITLNGATLNVTDVKIIDWVSEPTDNLSLY